MFVFAFVKRTATLAPSVNTNPVRATVFSATSAAVSHTPKCTIFALPSNGIPSIVLAVLNLAAELATPPAEELPA